MAATAACRCGRGGRRSNHSTIEQTKAAGRPDSTIGNITPCRLVGARLLDVVRFLLRTVVFLGSSAIGLVVAAWLIPGVSVSVSGFIAAVVIFTVAQAILSPFFLKMASRYATAFLGGIGLASTLAALILASVLTHGLSIRGVGSWVAATVVVWLVTALATLLLPLLILRDKKNAS